MNWINIRLFLVHLLPGFLPTLLFFSTIRRWLDPDILGDKTNIFILYVLSSISAGIVIAHLKRIFIKPFLNWCNLYWIKYWFRRLLSRFNSAAQDIITLKEAHRRYEQKLTEAVKLWLKVRLTANPKIKAEIENNPILKKEYLNPTITSGDWWALLSLREKHSLQFYLEEYFSFYEFSSNFLVSVVVTETLAIFFWMFDYLSSPAFKWISLAFGITFILFHELTIFWVLATYRFIRKVLLFSIIESPESPSE